MGERFLKSAKMAEIRDRGWELTRFRAIKTEHFEMLLTFVNISME